MAEDAGFIFIVPTSRSPHFTFWHPVNLRDFPLRKHQETKKKSTMCKKAFPFCGILQLSGIQGVSISPRLGRTALDRNCSKIFEKKYRQPRSVSATPSLALHLSLNQEKHTRDGFPGFIARNTWIENYVGSRFNATDH